MKAESIDILKQKIIRTYRKHGDEPYLRTNARIYTGNEIAEEIEKETEFGVECVNKLIQLTIDLLARDKMKYEPKDTRSVYDCKHFDEHQGRNLCCNDKLLHSRKCEGICDKFEEKS
jgi:hypothetical protein